MKRLPFLDHARGLVIALVALQHATQPYGIYWGDKYFVKDTLQARHAIFDGLFMWSDAFIMQALFFIAGLFVIPSLTRHGMSGFWQRKIIRIIIPWALAVVFLCPLLNFVVHQQQQDPLARYSDYWIHDHFAHSIPQAGYWFLSYLMFLTAGVVALHTIWPRVINALGAAVRWASHRPMTAVLGLGALCAVLISTADLLYGTPYWSRLAGIFTARANMAWSYVLFFTLGVGVRASGLLEDTSTLERFYRSWPQWLAGLTILSISYISYCTHMIEKGAITDAILETFYNPHATSANLQHVLAISLPRILPRTILHGFLVVFEMGTLLAILGRFTNAAPSRFWRSLGACSYGIYFFHEHLCVWVQYALVGAPLPAIAKWITAFIVSLTGAWAFTAAVRRLPVLRRVF